MKFDKKVLIIDDEEDFRNSFADLLREKFNVDTADNVNFTQKIKENNYNLILLDILMDGKDGDIVYDDIRKIDKGTKVVVLTHLSETNKKRLCFKEKNVPVFSKADEDISDKIIAYISSLKKVCDLTALIVDDEKDKRSLYAEILELVGVKNIDIFSTIGKARKKINEKKNKKDKYDIYLIDICFKKRGEDEAIGCELIEFLKKKDFVKNSVLIPLTCKEVGKEKLDKIEKEENIHPLYYDVIENFKEELEHILMISPFCV
jgi:DNA-binding NtrC family response regulator